MSIQSWKCIMIECCFRAMRSIFLGSNNHAYEYISRVPITDDSAVTPQFLNTKAMIQLYSGKAVDAVRTVCLVKPVRFFFLHFYCVNKLITDHIELTSTFFCRLSLVQLLQIWRQLLSCAIRLQQKMSLWYDGIKLLATQFQIKNSHSRWWCFFL